VKCARYELLRCFRMDFNGEYLGSMVLDRVKIHWIIGFSVQRVAIAAAPDIQCDANNEFTIEMHGILCTIVRVTRKLGRNGEIKRILDFSIKILFSRNSKHACAFHNARVALWRFRFFGTMLYERNMQKYHFVRDIVR